jgi:hypothetical protein
LKAALADMSAGDIMNAMARPFVHPVDAANFTADGETHFLAGEPRFKKGLGKKILILDVDSRPLDKEGHLNNPDMDWNNIKPLSAGLMSHHLYGMEAIFAVSRNANPW